MKLISATATALVLASAAEASVPAPDRPPMVEMLSKHGCYCSQVFGDRKMLPKPNGEPVDIFDRACFELMKCMQCEMTGSDNECDVLDKKMVMLNSMLYDGTYDEARMLCKEASRGDRCGTAGCVCMNEFTGFMNAKQLMMTKNKQKKEVFELQESARCEGEVPRTRECKRPDDEEEEKPEKPIDEEEEEEEQEEEKPAPPTCEAPVEEIPAQYVILHSKDMCFDLPENKENAALSTINSATSAKEQKELWNMAQSYVKPPMEKECESNAQIAFNERSNIVVLQGTKEKCLQFRKPTDLGSAKELRVAITRDCNENLPTWHLGGKDGYWLVPDMFEEYCLAAMKFGSRKGEFYLTQPKGKGNNLGANCMRFKAVEKLEAVQELVKPSSADEVSADDAADMRPVDPATQCRERCANAGEPDEIKRCYYACKDKILSLANNWCKDRCDGNKCCIKKCEAEKPDILKPKPVEEEKPTKPTNPTKPVDDVVKPEKPVLDDVFEKCGHCLEEEAVKKCDMENKKDCAIRCMKECQAAAEQEEEEEEEEEVPTKPGKPTKPSQDEENTDADSTKPGPGSVSNGNDGNVDLISLFNRLSDAHANFAGEKKWNQKKIMEQAREIFTALKKADEEELAKMAEKMQDNAFAAKVFGSLDMSVEELVEMFVESANAGSDDEPSKEEPSKEEPSKEVPSKEEPSKEVPSKDQPSRQ